jgi:beta-galactosidase
MRSIIPFNDNWLYWADEVGNNLHDDAFERVTLPHTNKILPQHNFDVREYCFISTYRKRFKLPEARNGRRVYIDFDGAMIAATVTINGHEFPEHRGGYVPFSFDLTDYLRDDEENLLVVELDSSERKDIPPFGHIVDYLTFGGIYRDVWLRYVEPVHIKDVFVRTKDVLTDKPRVEVDIWINNQSNASITTGIYADLAPVDEGISEEIERRIEIPANSTIKITLELEKPHFELWSPENPKLETCYIALKKPDDDMDALDECEVKYGFREAHFSKEDGKFYLNGEPLKLRGLNRHQTYPYIGAAASTRLQRRDADIVKYELGCNIVRTSHYPQSPHFLNRCDEIGLLVFEEIPGWQHIGDADWQALAVRDLRAMIERDRNHPSIIMWGVRINESPDDSAFYEETNTVAHELDSTRQTGGVRYFRESQFLEDVFTYNDFSNTILEPMHLPQLVTEFNGHMFPTKTWDQEERQVEHALRHAKIQNLSHGMDNLAGAIGWCAFDYNTHIDFGSDTMCYHGVMDIFRLPKYAAAFYASQQPPTQKVVLQAATIWAMGDRSVGGINPLVVFSNCDEIAVSYGGVKLGRFKPDREEYGNLPYPPFVVKGINENYVRGTDSRDLQIIGYINGEQVAEQWIECGAIPSQLILTADDAELNADGQDTTRIAFKIADKYGNRLPYANQVVTFEIEGDADLIGDNPFALIGGQAALYLRARHKASIVTIRAKTSRVPEASVTVILR